MIALTLPVPPSVNNWTRALGRGRQVKTRAARDYMARVATICQAAKVRPYREPVRVTFTWYRARRAGDLDNRLKVGLDSLCGYAFGDDRWVEEIIARRVDGEAPARIEVTVEPIDPRPARSEAA